MYKITWVDGRQEILCADQRAVEDAVSEIGTDGGLVKWITTHKAVISFYNTIIAYVEFVEPEIKKEFLSNFTDEAVQALPNDEAKELLIAYDKYVARNIDDETYQEIESLLYFISFIWVNRQ